VSCANLGPVLQDIVDTMDLTFREARDRGVIDRPVSIVVRECEGLPRGTVQQSITAYGEMT
jgi:branched-chain amino acid transport system substrate-binding protein